MSYTSLFDDLNAAPSRAARPVGGPAAALMAEFSDQQAQALALPVHASAVIRAGAGSGKTRLLVARAVALMSQGVAPQDIALISFTRKSAAELRERIAARTGSPARTPVCSTLHALALRACKADSPHLRLITEAELAPVLQDLRGLLGPSAGTLTDREIAALVGRQREARDTSGSFGLAAAALDDLLAQQGAHDFARLLDDAKHQRPFAFSHVLVDEAQDLSALQLEFIAKISRPGAATWFVGDDDQSIFIFCGAKADRMRELAERPSYSRITLTRNYRCARSIVAAANRLMEAAPDREAVLWEATTQEEGSVALIKHADKDSEFEAAAHAARTQGHQILVRTRAMAQRYLDSGIEACTIHEAKGLEWDKVWVAGLVQGCLPHALADADEERRLMYVAVTRAKRELVLSYACAGRQQPSQFLTEAHAVG